MRACLGNPSCVPRYDSSLDDPPVEDGDVGYLGVNVRLPSWQLPEGMLSLSENGRIDGSWVPRRGVDVVTEGSLDLGTPLRLPFWLIDTSGGLTVSAGSRVGELVTLTVTGHGLPVGGNQAASVIVNPSGANNSVLFEAVTSGTAGEGISIEYQMIPDSYEVIVSTASNAILVSCGQKAALNISGSLTSDGVTPVVFPSLIRVLGEESEGKGIWTDDGGLSADYVVVVDLGNWILRQEFPLAEWSAPADVATPDLVTVWTPLSSATGSPTVTTTAALAQQVINAVNADHVANDLVTASASGTVTGEVAAVGPVFLQGGSGGSAYLGLELVTGSPTVDPNGVWRMTPTDADTLEFEIPGATGSESYTVTTAKVLSRLDDSASSTVLGSCLFSNPASSNAEFIFLAFGSGVAKVKLSDGSSEMLTLPGSETLDGEITMIQAMDKVLLFRGGIEGLEWIRGASAFTAVASGTYTQPQTFTVAGTFVDVVNGACTITGLTNNTVAVGDTITIHATNNADFLEFKGETYFVYAANGTSFSFYIPVKDLSTIGADTLSLGRQVSLGGGFIHAPAFPWAIYFQRRIWGTYSYLDGGSGTFTDRNIRDEIVAGDILDTDTFDPIQNQFRITGGVADRVVGLHPYFDDTLLVMNRNSIHAISGTIGSLADTSVKELTREIGCLARKSVVTQGNNVFFLSDNGVYGLDFFNDYNLRGIGKPLSEAIQPYMDRISQNLAPDAIGVYFNNRIWMAVPLDSSPRQGDATGNNAILVFNLLNAQWESVDTFGDPNFLIINLIVGTAGKRNDLYAVTATGGIHILDKMDEDYDNIATNAVTGATQFPILAAMTTRSYMGRTLERKRFTRMSVQMKSGTAQSDIGMTFTTEDPDGSESEVLASSTMNGPLDPQETADVRQRIGGERGFNGSIRIRRVIGRPEIRGTKILATTANRATLTQR